MTTQQFCITAILASFLAGMGFCESVHGQTTNRPPTSAEIQLEDELSGYIADFTETYGMTNRRLRYAVMVLPAVEIPSATAIVYSWPVPHPPHETEIWIALFTFHSADLLDLPPMAHRVIAAHEVAHLTSTCLRFRHPGKGATDEEINYFRSNVESCADILAAQLTSYPDTLETLKLLKARSDHEGYLDLRIEVIRQIMEMERILGPGGEDE